MSTIRIKKGTGVPSSLQYGELAINDSSVLYAGDSTNTPQLMVTGSTPILASGMELVSEQVLGAAATTVTFSSLDGDTDGAYYIHATILNTSASSATYSFLLNGSAITSTRQLTTYNSTSVTYSRSTNPGLAMVTIAAGLSGSIDLFIPITKTLSSGSRYAIANCCTATTAIQSNISAWDITTPLIGTNITSLSIQGSIANSIGINSMIRFWKLV